MLISYQKMPFVGKKKTGKCIASIPGRHALTTPPKTPPRSRSILENFLKKGTIFKPK
jgi:hypothetical protein